MHYVIFRNAIGQSKFKRRIFVVEFGIRRNACNGKIVLRERNIRVVGRNGNLQIGNGG